MPIKKQNKYSLHDSDSSESLSRCEKEAKPPSETSTDRDASMILNHSILSEDDIFVH